jgi:hypothetical protein|tara:strand:- start:316 stop:570 length:255 start_codon:yes stop_codon:yes gene_type:complete
MTDTRISVEFIVNAEALSNIEDIGLPWKPYGKLLSVTQALPETLIESLNNDELVEFIGIDAEHLVYLNIKEFSHRGNFTARYVQ